MTGQTCSCCTSDQSCPCLNTTEASGKETTVGMLQPCCVLPPSCFQPLCVAEEGNLIILASPLRQTPLWREGRGGRAKERRPRPRPCLSSLPPLLAQMLIATNGLRAAAVLRGRFYRTRCSYHRCHFAFILNRYSGILRRGGKRERKGEKPRWWDVLAGRRAECTERLHYVTWHLPLLRRSSFSPRLWAWVWTKAGLTAQRRAPGSAPCPGVCSLLQYTGPVG